MLEKFDYEGKINTSKVPQYSYLKEGKIKSPILSLGHTNN
jgi:hypothetical protein